VENPHKGKSGMRRIWNIAGYSRDGLRFAYKHKVPFREKVLLAIALVPLALWLPGSQIGKILMAGSVLLVMIVELLDSAIEATVNRISPELNELSRRARDYCSAAVVVSLVNALVVWAMMLL
jgi:diacylglycerol kinase (ATP)